MFRAEPGHLLGSFERFDASLKSFRSLFRLLKALIEILDCSQHRDPSLLILDASYDRIALESLRRAVVVDGIIARLLVKILPGLVIGRSQGIDFGDFFRNEADIFLPTKALFPFEFYWTPLHEFINGQVQFSDIFFVCSTTELISNLAIGVPVHQLASGDIANFIQIGSVALEGRSK